MKWSIRIGHGIDYVVGIDEDERETHETGSLYFEMHAGSGEGRLGMGSYMSLDDLDAQIEALQKARQEFIARGDHEAD